jgi:hypothetical protein
MTVTRDALARDLPTGTPQWLRRQMVDFAMRHIAAARAEALGGMIFHH